MIARMNKRNMNKDNTYMNADLVGEIGEGTNLSKG